MSEFDFLSRKTLDRPTLMFSSPIDGDLHGPPDRQAVHQD